MFALSAAQDKQFEEIIGLTTLELLARHVQEGILEPHSSCHGSQKGIFLLRLCPQAFWFPHLLVSYVETEHSILLSGYALLNIRTYLLLRCLLLTTRQNTVNFT